MISRFTAVILLAALHIGLSLNVAHAQSSGGGLKLGESAEPAGTLDLGAAPDAEAPPPPRPTSTAPATSNSASGPELQRFGAWNVACDPAGKNCAMAQIGNDSTGTPVLEVVVRKLEEPLEVAERTAIAVLDVITPLGVVLIEGLTISIDNGPEESAPFQICTEQGCLVREPIDDDLISRFKRGNSAVVSVIAANQGEVSASLSLSGFTKAYESL